MPDAEADVFMGHKAEGSATGKRYIHRRPEFLKSVAEGIELLFTALSDLIARTFAGHERSTAPRRRRLRGTTCQLSYRAVQSFVTS